MFNASVNTLPGTVQARLAATGVLLKRPVYHALEDHDVVYALRGGRVGSRALGRYRLPEGVRDTVAVIPDVTNTNGLAMLPVLADMLERMAPWVDVHVVPRILRIDGGQVDFGRASGAFEIEGRLYRGAGGLSLHAHDLILLESPNPVWMSHMLCHEIMHQIWKHLSLEACSVLEEAVTGGSAWRSVYHESAEERVCRAFQA